MLFPPTSRFRSCFNSSCRLWLSWCNFVAPFPSRVSGAHINAALHRSAIGLSKKQLRKHRTGRTDGCNICCMFFVHLVEYKSSWIQARHSYTKIVCVRLSGNFFLEETLLMKCSKGQKHPWSFVCFLFWRNIPACHASCVLQLLMAW